MSHKNISIFGIARSGTKILQLYIAYLLLQNNEKIRLNYEPYYWHSRLLGSHNYNGMSFNIHDKQFPLELSEIPDDHKDYIIKLASQKEEVVLSKFIRGNGRMNLINKLLGAELSFLIVRPMNEVLNSIGMYGFNLYSVGQKIETSFWKRFLLEANQLELTSNVPEELLKTNDPLIKNGLYWYLSNLSALQNINPSVKLINFKNLKESSGKISKAIIGKKSNIDTSVFTGNQIHNNELLLNQKQEDFSGQLFRKIKFYLISRKIRWSDSNSPYTGDIISQNKAFSFGEIEPFKKSKNPEIKLPKELLDLNGEIMDKVEQLSI